MRSTAEGMQESDAHETRMAARRRGRLAAAKSAGALEGWLEAMDEYHPEDLLEDAMDEVRQTTRASSEEFRRQARSPGGQRLAHDLKTGGTAVSDKAEGAWDAAQERADTAWVKTEHGVRRVGYKARALAHDVEERVEHGASRMVDRMEDGVEQVRARSHYLAESARRSKDLPATWSHAVRASTKARMQGMARSAGMWTAAGLVGGTAFVVFTIGAVSGLNILLGAPWGALIVAAAYGLGAYGLIQAAGAARNRAQETAEEEMEKARVETRFALGPAKEAFARRPYDSSMDDSLEIPSPSAPKTQVNEHV